MLKILFITFNYFFGFVILSSLLYAQSDHFRVTVANLSQDISLLSQQVKTMRLEMEELRRENARLRVEVAASTIEAQKQINNLSSAIESLRIDYQKADETQKNQTIDIINQHIITLAKETQSAINSVARLVDSQPQLDTSEQFSEDYPRSGKPYIVRSGDTLSAIALEHGSTIKHIQNANKIIDPSRDLRVGETIFIPINR